MEDGTRPSDITSSWAFRIVVVVVFLFGMTAAVWLLKAKRRVDLESPMGCRMAQGVIESGFFNQEYDNVVPFRWTNGHAKLQVPVDAKNQPKALEVRVRSHLPRGNILLVRVNGTELFNDRIAPGDWEGTFRLEGAAAHEEVTIEIVSDTWRPCDVFPGNTDKRSLGVDVRGVRLLNSSERSIDAGLRKNGGDE